MSNILEGFNYLIRVIIIGLLIMILNKVANIERTVNMHYHEWDCFTDALSKVIDGGEAK